MLKKLFHFEINRETYLALAGGIVVILLSALLRFDIVDQNPFLAITVRDLFMILGIGMIFVLLRIQKADLKKYGLSLDKWKRNIIINIILASLLAFIMIKDLDTANFTLSTTKIFEITYIFIAGIFEVLFFYTYQRVVFERSFGKIPAIILVAVFYSLHHIGFQPEFLKLFFVGISYVAVVLLTNNALSIFPFYWGVALLWMCLFNRRPYPK